MMRRMSLLLEAVRAEGDHVLDGHLVLRDGTGLVHAKDIHPRQGLYAAHVVDKRFLLRQAHDARGEGHAGEQV